MILVHGNDGLDYLVNENLITSIIIYKNGSGIHFDNQNFVMVNETADEIVTLINKGKK